MRTDPAASPQCLPDPSQPLQFNPMPHTQALPCPSSCGLPCRFTLLIESEFSFARPATNPRYVWTEPPSVWGRRSPQELHTDSNKKLKLDFQLIFHSLGTNDWIMTGFLWPDVNRHDCVILASAQLLTSVESEFSSLQNAVSYWSDICIFSVESQNIL